VEEFTMTTQDKPIFVLMGVSGCGKSAVAKQVAYNLDASFLDGDFLHPKANILKMRNGTPLNDEDRMPWLNLISNAAFAMRNVNDVSIIICSALKRKYRDIIRGENKNIHFIYLKGSYDVIAKRLAKRKGHYQKSGMLQSQFDTLEEPTIHEKNVYTVNIEQSLTDVVNDTEQVIRSICNCE
jgi:gluconokinase